MISTEPSYKKDNPNRSSMSVLFLSRRTTHPRTWRHWTNSTPRKWTPWTHPGFFMNGDTLLEACEEVLFVLRALRPLTTKAMFDIIFLSNPPFNLLIRTLSIALRCLWSRITNEHHSTYGRLKLLGVCVLLRAKVVVRIKTRRPRMIQNTPPPTRSVSPQPILRSRRIRSGPPQPRCVSCVSQCDRSQLSTAAAVGRAAVGNDEEQISSF
jgi:hypothetical protein